MALAQELKQITGMYEASKGRLEHNQTLYNIHEGALLGYVIEDMKASLNVKAFENAKDRIAPINVLKRLIDKLSKLYAKGVVRKLSVESETDQALFEELTGALDMNVAMPRANKFFNLFKYCAIEPYLDQGVPKLRVLPADRFIVYSTDRVNPLRPTHWSKIMGEMEYNGRNVVIFHTYTDKEFLIHDQEGELLRDMMAGLNNADGINPYGKIPAVYLNRSLDELIPQIDSDTLTMTKLIPILLSDLNYAMKFQCFSLIYGIDLDNAGLTIEPNAFWSFKTDTSGANKNPTIGTIKPEVDSDKALEVIKTQLALWMQSRNIKPGAVGDLSVANAASGIAKMIDESDTSEDRQEQVPYFIKAECEVLDLVMNHMHPVWIREPDYQLEKRRFVAGIKTATTFPEQKPIVDQSTVIDDQIKMMSSGLQDDEGALKEIYPDLTDDQIKERLAKVRAYKQANPKANGMAGVQNGNIDQTQNQEGSNPKTANTDG
jgi:hypothetical protein